MDLLTAINEQDRGALSAMVADNVVFNGPVTTYTGSDQVVHLLALIGSVLDDITATGEVESVTFVKAHLDGEELDGALIETRDESGRIGEITLLMRPLAMVQTAVRRMARALAEGSEAS